MMTLMKAMMMMPKVMMIRVEEGVSAFLNPVRAADNIGASPDRVQEFDNGDDHPDKHDGDHCDGYEDDNIDKREVRLSLEKDQVGL